MKGKIFHAITFDLLLRNFRSNIFFICSKFLLMVQVLEHYFNFVYEEIHKIEFFYTAKLLFIYIRETCYKPFSEARKIFCQSFFQIIYFNSEIFLSTPHFTLTSSEDDSSTHCCISFLNFNTSSNSLCCSSLRISL